MALLISASQDLEKALLEMEIGKKAVVTMPRYCNSFTLCNSKSCTELSAAKMSV